MKEFKKTEEGLFICEECGKLCKDKTVLSIHNIKIHNLNTKEYFDKWVKEEGEGICKICGKETLLVRSDYGYKNCCSRKCINIYSGIRTKEEIFKKFGVENVYELEDIKYKCKQTKKERYGDEKYQNRERIEKTNMQRYGVKNPFESPKIREKCYQKNLNNYGVKYNWQREDVKESIKQTCLKKFNCEHPSQNTEIFEKGLNTRFLIHKYKDTNVWYQGSYELDFLEKYYNKFNIQRGISIKYQCNGKNKVYHSDFYIQSLNLIIEIKSSWTLKIDDEIIEKKQATINNGFKYIMILDKVYDDLDNIVF